MKKFLSLVLAAMMLLSCAAAMAEDKNMTVMISDETEFNWPNKTEGNSTGTAETDVWLQVAADGQIDVTVPLVVVFKTNIDGGTATTTNSYSLTNNSTAALKVTKVVVEDQNDSGLKTTNNQSLVMGFVNDAEVQGVDKYSLKFDAETWTRGASTTNYIFNGSGLDMKAPANTENLEDLLNGAELTYEETKSTLSKGAGVEEAGLFRMEGQNSYNTSTVDGAEMVNGNSSKVRLTLHTSPLSFVTTQNTAGKTDESGKVTEPDKAYGVKLFNIEYTVAIDDSTSLGSWIQGTFEDGDNDDTVEGTIGEITYAHP